MQSKKLTDEQIEQRCLKVADKDSMPASVATDILCIPDRRMSNRERKVYLDARQRVFLSTEKKKPRETKMINRLHEVTLSQLGKWLTRASKKRRGVQRKYSAAVELPDSPIKARLVASLDLRAGMVELFMDVAETEILWRSTVCQGRLDGDLLGVTGFGTFAWVLPTAGNVELGVRPRPGKWQRTKIPDYASPKYSIR